MKGYRILAISGGPSAGKTTVSRLLADRLHVPVRHCGEAVKARANELQCSMTELSQSEHQKIDSETREWVTKQASICIVEGRFLRDVLSGLSDVLLIELRCSAEEEARRSSGRVETVSAAPLFRINISEKPVAQPQTVIDTDTLTPEQVTSLIEKLSLENSSK